MISAIIPVGDFNRDYQNLVDTIESCRQSNIEIVIVNDSSNLSNRMEKTLLKLGNEKLHIVNSSARSPGGARNIGLKYATGDNVIFWDSDDQPEIHKLFMMDNILRSTKCDFVVGGYTQIEENLNRKYHEPQIHSLKMLTNPGIWRVLFKRNSIKKLKFINSKIGEDQIFMGDVLDLELTGFAFNEKVYTYRKNYKSLTSSANLISNFETTFEELEIKIRQGSKTQELIFFNLLLSYLKRTNIRYLKKSVKALKLALHNFKPNSFSRIFMILFLKMTYK